MVGLKLYTIFYFGGHYDFQKGRLFFATIYIMLA